MYTRKCSYLRGLIVLIFSIFFYSTTTVHAQSAKLSEFIDEYSPDRDVPDYYDPNQTSFIIGPTGGGSGLRYYGTPDDPADCTQPDSCNGIYFPYVGGPLCNPKPVTDIFGNVIHAVGWYGNDDRQRYYVYYPAAKTPTSPIVMVIHGGGWSIGPDADSINGYPFSIAPKADSVHLQESLVADLIDSGFVVVSLLYRLSKYGETTSQITGSTINIDDQVDDIKKAVIHIDDNFSTCLSLNADEIQILGESAGAQLALLYAHNEADDTYVKSVVAQYAPTNMNQYGDYLNSPSLSYTCGNPYWFTSLCANFPTVYFPHYFFWVENQRDWLIESHTVSCTPEKRTCRLGPDLFEDVDTQTIYFTYNFMQSAIADTSSTPYTYGPIRSVSPHNTIDGADVIPTFVMHGESDLLIPYDEATDSMEIQMDANGGLIQSGTGNVFEGTSAAIPTSYTGSDKHMIKTYTNADHGFTGITGVNKAIVRLDVIKWLYGHK